MKKVLATLFSLLTIIAIQAQPLGDVKGPLSASVVFTRPATTTAYVSGDVVSTNQAATCFPLCFTNVIPRNGGAIAMQAKVFTTSTTATVPFDLRLFSSTNIYLLTDNGAAQLRWADTSKVIDTIAIPALATDTGNDSTYGCLWNVNSDRRITFNIGSAGAYTNRNLYGYLIIKGAWTPVGEEQFRVELQTLAP